MSKEVGAGGRFDISLDSAKCQQNRIAKGDKNYACFLLVF